MITEGNFLFDRNVMAVIPNFKYALDSIIKIFSMDIPSDSFLFAHDPLLTREFFSSVPESEYLTYSSIIFDFQSSLQNSPENPTLAEILRKMIAIGLYSPQIYSNSQFADEIFKLVCSYKQLLTNDKLQCKKHCPEMSFPLGFLLYSISTFITKMDFGNNFNTFLSDIFDIYLSENFLDENSAPLFFVFYITIVTTMEIENIQSEKENEVLKNLINVIISTLSFPVTLIFSYLSAFKKFISYLTLKNLPIPHKIQILSLLTTLASFYPDASTEIIKKENVTTIVHFIYSYLQSLNIDIQCEESQKPINLDQLTPKRKLPASDLLDPFFKDNPYKHLTQEETSIHTSFQLPDIPEIITNNKDITILFVVLVKLFQAIQIPTYFTHHLTFLKTFIDDERFSELPIASFFAMKWISMLLHMPEKDNSVTIELIVQSLHKISLITKLFNVSFFVFNIEAVKKFTTELLIYLSSLCYNTDLFTELIQVVEEAIQTARFDSQLMKCLAILASLSNETFIKSCQEKRPTFSKELITYQNIDLTKCDDVERIQNNRRLLFNLLEKLSADRSIFEYLFTKQDYNLAVLSHFYDVTTSDFALAQIKMAIAAFNANIPSVRYIFKFIATKLFHCHELPRSILYMIIQFCIEGFKSNPLLMSKIFSESHFLKTLIDYSIEIEATNCIEIVLELLTCIFQQAIDYSPNIAIFLKLSPLVKSAKNMPLDEFLFKIVFYDDLKMTKVRKIINPGPLSLLYQIYKDDSRLLSEFLSFIEQCFDLSMFEITQTNLSSQLIEFIYEYRKKTEKDELFDQVLAFLQKIMMYSISPSDLLSFFQLFTIILPEKIQPFYTIDLLNTLIQVFKNKKTTTLSYFHFESENHGIELPPIPCDVFNDSFSLVIKMFLFEKKGNIFQFCSDNDFICLSITDDGLLNFNGENLSIGLPLLQWFKLTFHYSKSGHALILVDEKPIGKIAKKFEFKEMFSSNSVVQQLKCDIEYIRLEKSKETYFEFNAYSFCQKYTVYKNSVAILDGSVHHLPPPPKVILNQIGGVAIIIPLLAQIELYPNSEKKPELLNTILTLIEETLLDSNLLQSNFYSIEGFRMVGELLSILPTDIFINETVHRLFGIFSILTEKLLQKQYIEYVLLNMNIWLYITKIQPFYIGHLFSNLIQLIQKDSFFLSIINVRSIIYIMKCYLYSNVDESTSLDVGPKITVDGKILAERPTDLTQLREQFIEFILQIAEIQFTQDDLFTIIHFSFSSFDTSLQSSAIWILSKLIQSKNKYMIFYLSNQLISKNTFYKYFDLLQTSDSELLNSLLLLFDATSNDVVNISSSKLNYVILTRLANTNLHMTFLEHLEIFPLKIELKVPIFLYVLTVMPERDRVPEKFEHFLKNSKIQQNFQNNEYFYYCFFVVCFLSPQLQEILERLLRILMPICLRCENPFSPFLLFMQLIESQFCSDELNTTCDLTKLVQLFLTIALDFLPSINKKYVTNFIVNAFLFMFKIPIFDKFSTLAPGISSIQSLSYLDILNSLATKSQIDLNYSYGLRLTMENVWIDSELAQKVVDLIINQLDNIENPGNRIFELLTILISTGIQLNEEFFIQKIEYLSSLFYTHKDYLSNQVIRNSFVIFIGSLARLHLKGDRSIYSRIESILSKFDNIPLHVFKMKSTDVSIHDLIYLFAQNLCEIEENIEKQMNIVNSVNMENFLFEAASIPQPPCIKLRTSWMDIDESIKMYSNYKNRSKIESMKKYKQLFQSLSSDNGPWTNPENPPAIHYKLDINFAKRTKLVPNLKFNDHREASLARNLGSSKDAQQIVRDQIAKMKLQSFSGDFSLIDFDETETTKTVNTKSIDKVILKCQCQMITTKQVHNGYLNLTDSTIVFDSTSKYVKIYLNRVKKVLLRRYLQDNTAIEVFSEFSKVYFFQFQNKKERSLFLNKLSSLKIPSIKLIQKRNDEVFKMAKKVTEKWQRGEISNYSYILKLNIIAGRSFNDLSQYPVFPWVICDYQSPSIDLSDQTIYRDLTKPIGAYTKQRLEYMKIKMQEAINDETRYLYGSFYSSSAVVIGYLIRMEPFTSLHIKLQNGRFDIPDRLFTSIPAAWESVTTTQMDFRELIPEFFAIPDFLNNMNKFDLGVNSAHEQVNDVKLPPWAKDSHHFIEINRQALESKDVSINLHYWIDLIFGPHSRLPLSIEVDNVFHPYFYDSAMDNLNKIEPSQRELTKTLIKEYAACFGFCPNQIFDKIPEKKYKIPIPQWPVIRFVDQKAVFSFAGSSSVQTIFADNFLIATTQDLQFVVMKVDVIQSTVVSYGKFNVTVPRELKDIVPIVSTSEQYAVVAVPWTTNFLLFAYQKHAYSLIGNYINAQHISALSISTHYLATASTDSTLRAWRIKEELLADIANNKTNDILEPVGFLAKHLRPIVFVEISEKLNSVYSISGDGMISCISLSDGRYLHGVELELSDPSAFMVTKGGFVLAAFNGPDFAVVVILDQNLEEITRASFDGSLKCWTICIKGGIEYLAIVLKSQSIEIGELPYWRRTTSIKSDSLTIESASFVKKPGPKLVLGSNNGELITIDIE